MYTCVLLGDTVFPEDIAEDQGGWRMMLAHNTQQMVTIIIINYSSFLADKYSIGYMILFMSTNKKI